MLVFIAFEDSLVDMYYSSNNSYLGVYIRGSLQNENGFLLDSIDLYHSPLKSPLLAVISFLTNSSVVLIGVLVQMKALKLINRDKGIMAEICKVYILGLMIGALYWIIFSTITDFVYPVHQVIGQWFCSIGWFVMYVCFTVVSFNSFVIAVMRYFFIVWREKAELYGKQKIKKIFLFLSFFVPLIMTVWMAIDTSEIDGLSFVNKCYGNYHKVFLIEESSLDIPKQKFCLYEENKNYGSFRKIIAIARQISCMTRIAIMTIIGFNFTESIIYYKTIMHMIR